MLPDVHLLPGVPALFGIESPGLTASMVIDAYAAQAISTSTVS